MNVMRVVKRLLVVVFGIVIALALCIGGYLVYYNWRMGPMEYSAPAITATVVDESTGKPVEGAAVLARWNLHHTLGGGLLFHHAEARTGPDGAFHIDGWGPKRRPWFMAFSDDDPTIHIYKPGYRMGGGSNHEAYVPAFKFKTATGVTAVPMTPVHPDQRLQLYPLTYSQDSVRFCYYNGKTMALAPVRNAREEAEAYKEADDLQASLFPVMHGEAEEGWKHLPNDEQQRLKSEEIKGYQP